MRFDAELYVLNVDPRQWHRGIGSRLFARCVDHLATRGRGSFYLWVLVANARARRFYEILGGMPQSDSLRDAHFDGVGVPSPMRGQSCQLPATARTRRASALVLRGCVASGATFEGFTMTSRRECWAGVDLDDRPSDRPIFVAVEDDAVIDFTRGGSLAIAICRFR